MKCESMRAVVKRGSKRMTLGVLGMSMACLLTVAPVNVSGQTAKPSGQAAQQPKPRMSEDVFKNVQALKGIPVDEFMSTMGFISAALSLNCLDCHTNESASDFAQYAVDTPIKATARKMIFMVNAINKENFGGARMVTCYTCHRADVRPKAIPSLAEQYGTPPPEDPNDVAVITQPAPGAPTAAQILDKYIDALGGAQKVASLTSYTAKGTYAGYDTDFMKVPAEVFAQAPNLRTVIAHPPGGGDNTTTYDGHRGWNAATNTQIPEAELTGGNLDGAELDAEIAFPAHIKDMLTRWRSDFPPETIGDHDVTVIQGIAPRGSRVKLFFDTKTGLLVRMTRFANTLVGVNPMEVDYSDYRDVNGVKVPFHWLVAWTDGKSEFDLTDLKPNVTIDSSKFGAAIVAAEAAPAKP